MAEVLDNSIIRTRLVAAVCAVEHCSYAIQNTLLNYASSELAKTLISGMTPDKQMLFAPIPNFIFTRDIGITINNYLLLNKPAKIARTHEALLMQYVFFNHQIFDEIRSNIIEIPDNEHQFLMPDDQKSDTIATLEGGVAIS